VPLVVLSATVIALVAAKVRSDRRGRGPTPHVAPPAPSDDASSPTRRDPPLSGPPELGAGHVPDGGVRMLHGDAQRTHRARGRAPRSPKERWRTKIGGHVVTQPVLSLDEQTIYVTSYEGALVALDRKGVPKWKVPLGDRVYATPYVADDGAIYVGSDAKKFFCVASDGVVRFKLDVDGEADTAAAPVPDGRLAFAAGSTLYVISLRGDVRARFRAKKKIFTAPAVGERAIYVGSHDRFAYAVRFDGTHAWATELGADVDGGPAVADDGSVVFGTDGGRVVKLDGERGSVLWSSDVGGYVRGALSIGRDGSILAGVYGPTPGTIRLAPDGRFLGAFRVAGTGSRDFGVHGGPLEDEEGTLVFGTEDDHVYAIERSGQLRFRLDRTSDVDAPITLTRDGALIVGSDDGTVAELGD
jgi:outer membrane protein assembly factor BamB